VQSARDDHCIAGIDALAADGDAALDQGAFPPPRVEPDVHAVVDLLRVTEAQIAGLDDGVARGGKLRQRRVVAADLLAGDRSKRRIGSAC